MFTTLKEEKNMSKNIEVHIYKESTDLPLPRYETEHASGMDIRADLSLLDIENDGDLALAIPAGASAIIPTGIYVAIPPGYEIQIRPRSGLAAKLGVTVLNSPGTIDADYRGEIKVILKNHGENPVRIGDGDRIAQIVLQEVPRIVWKEFHNKIDLGISDRGDGGLGSTGKN